MRFGSRDGIADRAAAAKDQDLWKEGSVDEAGHPDNHPVTGEYVAAVARVRRAGRTIAVVDIDVLDEKQALVAIGRGTYLPQHV